MAYCFANECSYDDARRNCIFSGQEEPITNQTIANWYIYFRELVAGHFIDQIDSGSKIGGPGRIVQVDESMIGHRKYNRDRLVEGTWVLGMVDNAGQVRLEIVETRDKKTLTDLIMKHVAIGSTIHSDSWRGYNTDLLGWQGFGHSTVNHSVEFVALERAQSSLRAHKQLESSGRPPPRPPRF